MKANSPPYLFLFILCLIGGISGFFIDQTNHPYYQVMVTLESSIPAETQLFYDIGKGFNENDSIKKVIYQANNMVTLNYDLYEQNLYGLRFDPSRSPSKIIMHNISVQYKAEKPFSVPLDSLKAEKDIKLLHFDGKALTLETTDMAEDPILLLTRIGGPAPDEFKQRRLLFILAGAVVALLFAFFIVWIYRSLNSRELRT